MQSLIFRAMISKTQFSFTIFFVIAIGILTSPIYSAELKITADQFNWNQQTAEITAHPRVVMTNGPLMITADYAKYKQTANTVTLWQNIHVTRDKLQLSADRVTANNRTRIIEGAGNIRFIHEQISGKSDACWYQVSTNMIKLIQNARIRDGENTLSGDIIVVNFTTKTISVKGKSVGKFTLDLDK